MVIAITALSYVVDAFGVYADSAIAATIVVRSCFGAVLPLVGPPLYAELGIGWGNSILGFFGLSTAASPFALRREAGEEFRNYEKLGKLVISLRPRMPARCATLLFRR